MTNVKSRGQRASERSRRRWGVVRGQYSYFNHWGNHAGAALRALYAVSASARLDVMEEPVAG